jgi:hypothetical protein
MWVARIAPALGLAVFLACADGRVGTTVEDSDPPAERAGAPGAPEAAAPAAGPGDTGGPSAEVPVGAKPVEFEVIAPATHTLLGIRTRRREVIRTFEEWQAWFDELYSHMTPRPPALGIDFDSRMIVAVTTGVRYTGGHAITVESIHETADGTLYVTVLTTSPAVGCVTTQMMTSPSAAVSLERREAEVVFVERELTLEC